MQEYERKFVVTVEAYNAAAELADSILMIEDAYLPDSTGRHFLRVRRIARGADRFSEITLKFGEGRDRQEITFDAAALDLRLAGMVKFRHERREGGLKLHVENLPGRLLIGEVEGPPAAVDAWEPPEGWREVTGDPRYSNRRLAELSDEECAALR